MSQGLLNLSAYIRHTNKTEHRWNLFKWGYKNKWKFSSLYIFYFKRYDMEYIKKQQQQICYAIVLVQHIFVVSIFDDRYLCVCVWVW